MIESPEDTDAAGIARRKRRTWVLAGAYLTAISLVCATLLAFAIVTRSATSDVQTSQDKFQSCVVAVLFIPPADRAQLTDEKVAGACDVDVSKVRQIRDKLRE